jgi:hypothetical protein
MLGIKSGQYVAITAGNDAVSCFQVPEEAKIKNGFTTKFSPVFCTVTVHTGNISW